MSATPNFTHYNPANGPQCAHCGGARLYCGCADRGDIRRAALAKAVQS